MDDVWWGALGAMAGAISLAVVLRIWIRSRPRVLDADECSRAYGRILAELPLTRTGSMEFSTGAAQRILGYVSSYRGPVASDEVASGGLVGWWPMDARAIRELVAGVSAAVPAPEAPAATDQATATLFDDSAWAMLPAEDPIVSAELRALPGIQELLAVSITSTTPLVAPEEATLAQQSIRRLEELGVEVAVLTDQVDMYVAKRANDEPWRLSVSRAIAAAGEGVRRPEFRPALVLLDQVNHRLRALLDQAGWSDAVQGIRDAGERVLRISERREQLRRWLADPAQFERAADDALEARAELERLRAAVDREDAAIRAEWKEHLAAMQADSDRYSLVLRSSLDAVESFATDRLREQAHMDASAADALLSDAGRRLGSRGRTAAEWRSRAERARSGSTDEVLLAVIAVPGGEDLVREWLLARVRVRAVVLQEVRRLLDELRAAAEAATHARTVALVQTLEVLRESAEARLHDAFAAVQRSRERLEEHIVVLENWASGRGT